jgi:predicted PurR-regulated permease PerM
MADQRSFTPQGGSPAGESGGIGKPSERASGVEQGQPPPTSTGHHPLLGQPHDRDVEGPVAEAEAAAAAISTAADPLGPQGRRFNWRSPFFVGATAAAGVALTVGAIELFLVAAQTLLLITLGLFLAIGLEPAVSWLINHRFPRWAAVLSVFGGMLLLLAGFIASAIPALIDQGGKLVQNAPQYLQQVNDSSSTLGQLNERFHIQENIQQFLSDSGPGLASGILSVGEAVFSVFSSVLIVLVLTAYFMADLPRVRATLYRLFPAPRRPRAILLGDQILVKVGGYVLGNVVISVISAVTTFIWLTVFGVPYALLLAILVALLDLIPVVGSAVAGVLVALAAFSVSVPVGIATIGFFIAYKFVEDYVLSPKVFGKVLKLPALVTVVAILIGGALLGLVGALVALPIAAALLLLAEEVLFPRLDRAKSARASGTGPP